MESVTPDTGETHAQLAARLHNGVDADERGRRLQRHQLRREALFVETEDLRLAIILKRDAPETEAALRVGAAAVLHVGAVAALADDDLRARDGLAEFVCHRALAGDAVGDDQHRRAALAILDRRLRLRVVTELPAARSVGLDRRFVDVDARARLNVVAAPAAERDEDLRTGDRLAALVVHNAADGVGAVELKCVALGQCATDELEIPDDKLGHEAVASNADGEMARDLRQFDDGEAAGIGGE
jgi:hypothetical protein